MPSQEGRQADTKEKATLGNRLKKLPIGVLRPQPNILKAIRKGTSKKISLKIVGTWGGASDSEQLATVTTSHERKTGRQTPFTGGTLHAKKTLIRDEVIDPVRALSAAIILQAVDEYQHARDTWVRLDAILWLAGDEFPAFAEVAGLSTDDGLHFLQVTNDRYHHRVRARGAAAT